jgi:hypothetical protein
MDALSANIVNYASVHSEGSLRTAVATSVLKKTLDIQVQAAQALIAALPAPAGDPLQTRGTRLDAFA